MKFDKILMCLERYPLIFSLCLWVSCFIPINSYAEVSRGLKIVDQSGQAVGGYSGSYALLMGVSDYTAGWPDLQSIPSELAQVASALKEKGFKVKTVMNPNSSKLSASIKDFINDYGYDEDNRLLFYYAGHGFTRKNGAKGYIVPADTPMPNPSNHDKGFVRKAIGMNHIINWSRDIEAKHVMFLFDSCFSGSIFKNRAINKTPSYISAMTAKPVRQFITAGSAGETVPSRSVFTPAFIDAIQHGLGDMNQDGYISGTELGLYLQQKVQQHSSQTPQFGKISDYDLSRGDFVFFNAKLTPVKLTPAKVMPAAPIEPSQATLDLEYWSAVKDSDNAGMYQSYLKKFPEGQFEALATLKLGKLKIKSTNEQEERAAMEREIERLKEENESKNDGGKRRFFGAF